MDRDHIKDIYIKNKGREHHLLSLLLFIFAFVQTHKELKCWRLTSKWNANVYDTLKPTRQGEYRDKRVILSDKLKFKHQ